MSDLLEELRAAKELAATEHHKELARWLAAAEIAVPAVLRAAAAGNVTCREEAWKILAILGKDGKR